MQRVATIWLHAPRGCSKPALNRRISAGSIVCYPLAALPGDEKFTRLPIISRECLVLRPLTLPTLSCPLANGSWQVPRVAT
eukprot:443103-Amphidinium_carterae.2